MSIKLLLGILVGFIVLQAPGKEKNTLEERPHASKYLLQAGKNIQRGIAFLLLVGITTSVLIPNISKALERKQFEGNCTWFQYEKLCQDKCYYVDSNEKSLYTSCPGQNFTLCKN